MWFLADNRDGESVYVWADSWPEAERLCAEDGDRLIGEYVETVHVSDEEVESIVRRAE